MHKCKGAMPTRLQPPVSSFTRYLLLLPSSRLWGSPVHATMHGALGVLYTGIQLFWANTAEATHTDTVKESMQTWRTRSAASAPCLSVCCCSRPNSGMLTSHLRLRDVLPATSGHA